MVYQRDLHHFGSLYRCGPRAPSCSEDDVALASSLLCAEPSWPALTRVRTTPARAGTVPRAYLRLTEDRAVSLMMQDRLINAHPPERVESIAASHSAYFSKPDALARAILSVSRSS